jgi:hypothetical protein
MRPFLLSVALSADERAAVEALAAAAGLPEPDLVRHALWRLAEHYELRLPLETFAVGAPPARRRARARVRVRHA